MWASICNYHDKVSFFFTPEVLVLQMQTYFYEMYEKHIPNYFSLNTFPQKLL